MSSYARVIVNPAAGAGKTGRQWPQIMGLFQKHGLRFEHDITEAPGHAVELAKAAVSKGYEMVVSVGGDGTINEIVNGLHVPGSNGDVLLGIISTGTGSDYIKSLGVPRRYEEACKLLLSPKKRRVDLGVAEYSVNGHREERLFVNFAGMGFDAEVVRRMTQQFKRLGGMGSYLCGALTTIIAYRNRDVELKVDGGAAEKKICTIIMNIGRYGGGGMNTAPEARLDDGLFDVMVVGNVSKPDFLWSLPRIYKGTHVTHPRVTMMKGKSVELKAKQPMYLQADGDLIGMAPASFRSLPMALNVAV